MIATLLLIYVCIISMLLFAYLGSVAMDLGIRWLEQPKPEQVRINIVKIIFWPIVATYYVVMGGARVIKHLVSDL